MTKHKISSSQQDALEIDLAAADFKMSSLRNSTVEIVISEQWSWKGAWFLKEQYCPASNHTTLHDHVLLVAFSTVNSCIFDAFITVA